MRPFLPVPMRSTLAVCALSLALPSIASALPQASHDSDVCLQAPVPDAAAEARAAMLQRLDAPDAAGPIASSFVQRRSGLREWTAWQDLDGQDLAHLVGPGPRLRLRPQPGPPWRDGARLAARSPATEPGTAGSPAPMASVLDDAGAALVTLVRLAEPSALDGTFYRLQDADGRPLADVWVAVGGGYVTFSRSHLCGPSFAVLEPQARHVAEGCRAWHLTVLQPGLVPALAWPLLADFFMR